MKIFLLNFKLVLLFILTTANPGLDQFIKFTVRNFNPPESVKRVCTWQYAIIKLRVNEENKVIDVEVLNDVSKEVKGSLHYLKHYQFDEAKPYRGRSIIFCLSMENTRLQNCDVTRPDGYTHARAKDILKIYCNKHIDLVGKSIVLYNTFTTYFYEPVY